MSAMSTTVMSTVDHVTDVISSYHSNMTASPSSPAQVEPDSSQAQAVLAFAKDSPMSLNSSLDRDNHKETIDTSTTTAATNDIDGKNIIPENNPLNANSLHGPLESQPRNVVAAHHPDSETKHSPQILLAPTPGAVVAQHNYSPDRAVETQEHEQQQEKQQEKDEKNQDSQKGESEGKKEEERLKMEHNGPAVKEDEFTSSFSEARDCIRDLKELRGSQTDAEWTTTADKIQAIMTQMQVQWREMDKTRKLMAKNKGNNLHQHDHPAPARAGTSNASSRRSAKRESSLSKSDSDYSSSGGSSSRSSRRRI